MAFDPFIIKLILSFIVGGSWIAFTIWISERFGSKIGGILIGLPSTILVSLLFIAWTQSNSAAVSAVPVIPAATAVNSLFLVAFILLYRYGRSVAYLGAVLVWCLLVLPLVALRLNNLAISLVLAAFFFTLSLSFLRRFPHRKLPGAILTKKEILFRVIFGGGFVMLAVFFGKTLGPLWGGMFASFPAAFSSSLLILSHRHGFDFMTSVTKTMPYGNMGSIIFVIAFFFLVPLYGLALGVIAAYIASLIFAIFVYKRLSTKEIINL